MSESCKNLPWKDGYYSDETFRLVLYHIDGNVISRQFISEPLSQKDHPRFSNGTLRYGDFGEADREVTEKSGLTQYNVQISMPIFGNSVFVDLKATLSDDGANITFIEANKKLRALKWISEKDLIELKNSGDPADALPTHYEIQTLINQGNYFGYPVVPDLASLLVAWSLQKNLDTSIMRPMHL